MKVQIFAIVLFSIFAGSLAQSLCGGNFLGELVPDPTDCRKFYVCVLLVPIPGTCNDGQYFNAALRSCVDGDCDGSTETVPMETTTTEVENILDQICVDVFFGARPYLDYKRDFVGCIRGHGTLYSCYFEEEFNRDTNECEIPATVTETTTTTTTIFPPSTIIPGNICDGQGNNKVPHPNTEACELFIQCVNGQVGNEGSCPWNEIFSPQSRQCVSGSWQTCSPLVSTFSPTTVETTTTSELTERPSSTVETSQTFTEVPSTVPQTVPPTTVSESTEIPSTQPTVPPTTVPQTEIPSTPQPTEIPSTQPTVPPTTVPPTEPPTTTQTTPSNPAPFNPCDTLPSNVAIPNENSDDCRDYIRCSNGSPILLRCNEGQVFSDRQGRCINGEQCELIW